MAQLLVPPRLGLYLVVHLLGAVKHVDHDAQRSAQVLGGLCLACACRSCWSPAHGQVQRLGEGDVAPAKHRRVEVTLSATGGPTNSSGPAGS